MSKADSFIHKEYVCFSLRVFEGVWVFWFGLVFVSFCLVGFCFFFCFLFLSVQGEACINLFAQFI